MEYRDYYASLGVPRSASQADIKKAFRKLARQHHPDVNKADAGAEKRFKEVNEAYAVLGDAEKRKAYDSLGADWEMYRRAGAGTGRATDPFAGFGGFSGGASGPGGVRFEYQGDPADLAGFSDFFRTFFAGGAAGAAGPAGTRTAGGRSASGAGTRLRTASIEDLFAGLGDSGSELDGGRSASARPRTAPTFEAEAEVTLEEVAHGTKRHIELNGKRIEVTIPAGVGDGQRIRFSGVGPDKSDVYLRVKVKPHPVFTRDGANLRRDLPLTLAEALLGGEVPVETLNGRVLLRIPPETQSGRVFRLAAKGLPKFRGEGRGDLYAKANVVLPTGLDDRARELVQEFADHVRQPDPRAGRRPTRS